MVSLAVMIYAAAMTAANLSIAAFGPWISPINAFILIGLDLTLRDWMHMRLSQRQMLALIACSGGLTYALNPAAGHIAIASAVAFTAAAVVDWSVFGALIGRRWMVRVNGSNVAGAAVDSLIFPTLAFGVLMPQIIAAQFIAKVAGGAMWAAMWVWVMQRRAL